MKRKLVVLFDMCFFIYLCSVFVVFSLNDAKSLSIICDFGIY